MPHLVEVWKQYSPEGLVILALSDEDSAAVKGYVEKAGLPFPVASGSPSGGRYRVGGIPQGFLVDVDGNIVWEGHPMEDGWVKLLPQLLAETTPRWEPGERPEILAKAVEEARAGNLAKAWSESDRLLKKSKDDAEATAAIEAFQKDFLAFAGEKRKVAEERAAAGRYYRATLFLEKQVKFFAGTPVEQEWRELLKSWKADKEAKALFALDQKLAKCRELAQAGERDAALKALERLLEDAKGTLLETEVRDTRDSVRLGRGV